MHCFYVNAVVQPSVQHCPCYMAWKTKVRTWCRHCHLCPCEEKKRWLQGLFDPPSYISQFPPNFDTRPPLFANPGSGPASNHYHSLNQYSSFISILIAKMYYTNPVHLKNFSSVLLAQSTIKGTFLYCNFQIFTIYSCSTWKIACTSYWNIFHIESSWISIQVLCYFLAVY